MDRTLFAERLKALAKNDEKRSKTARLRDVLDDVEMALAAGAKRLDVLAELEAQGLQMSLSTFETTLRRLRAQRSREVVMSRSAQPHLISSAVPTLKDSITSAQTSVGDRTSHNPAELDRIIASEPNLTALARLARRSKK